MNKRLVGKPSDYEIIRGGASDQQHPTDAQQADTSTEPPQTREDEEEDEP